jgi:hypothetical protein
MAMRVGAMLRNMREAWWVPVVRLPERHPDGRSVVSLVLRERTLPRSVMVNAKGKRFTNEAANYNVLGGAFHQFDPSTFDYANQPCWLLFDHEYVRRYGGFGAPAGGPAHDWIPRSHSLAGLAEEIGIDPFAVEESVRRWNKLAASGQDEDFGRGDSAYDGWCGDHQQRTRHQMRPTHDYRRGDPPRRRHRNPWSLRCRKRDGRSHRDGLRRCGRHPRTRPCVRISGRTTCRHCGLSK